MATVDEPCAVFKIAEIMNGKKMPIVEITAALALMYSTNPAEAMTRPKTPPAAVTNRIGPTVFKASLVMALKSLILPAFHNKTTAKTKPPVKAIIGVPRKRSTVTHRPLIFNATTTELTAINNTGNTIGAKATKPPGSLPYSLTSSSYVFETIEPSSKSSSDFTFLPM